tara:strand:- start:36177 stop:36731 length:555 start_codon:yes stop_codon:yes gene_type:complete
MIALALSCAPATALAQQASPMQQPPQARPQFDRQGFVISLSLGLGITQIRPEVGDSENEAGLAGLNISLGGFLNPQLAVMARISGNNFSLSNGVEDTSFVSGFAGPVAQYWVEENIALEGGAGFGVVGPNPPDDDIDPEVGYALHARGTYRIAKGFQASVELTPIFVEDVTVVNIGFLAGYQWD